MVVCLGLRLHVARAWPSRRELFAARGLDNSGFNFLLRPPDDIVNPGSNLIYLVLAVEASPHLVVSFEESLQLFLQAVVLIVEIGHVLIKSIDLSLEVNLILEHLVGVLLQSADFVADRLLILLQLLEDNLEVGLLQLVVLALHVLIFVSLEELSLGILVVLVLLLEVAELAVQLVQHVFLVLDNGVSLRYFGVGLAKLLFLGVGYLVH